MRTQEQKLATKLRKAVEREAHRLKVWKKYPASVRYKKAAFKKGKKHQPQKRQKIKLGIQ